MMNVQKFIREFGWQVLKDQLFIEVKEYDCGLRVVNYNMIETPRNHPVADECRGLILDQDANVVSRSFDRFYNYGEAGTQDSFSFDNVVVFGKEDGSLVKIYWCPQTDRWEISTRGTAFAEAPHVFGSLERQNWTFRDAILDAMGVTEEEFQTTASEYLREDCTYIFEYVSPWNRIVSYYDEPHLIFLSVREHEDGVEFLPFNKESVNQFPAWKVKAPHVFQMRTLEEIENAIKSLPELDEGYVVFNLDSRRRVKIKSPRYVALHRLRGNGTPTWNNLAELVVQGETEEFLNYFGHFESLVIPIIEKMNSLLEEVQLVFDKINVEVSQKDFAIKACKYNFSSMLFLMRKNNISVAKSAFDGLSVSRRVALVESFGSLP